MGVRSSVLLWLPLAAWMAVILHFSSVAQVPVPAGTDISYLHVPAYFVLATLFLRLFLKEGVRRRFPLAIIASASYGMLMESVQPMFHARTFSFLDMILNLAGSCLIIAFLSKRGERALGMLTEY
ncbi:MAG: VanZ family protein [Candidatus Aenigmarchaeota archaeon]|nr:VanZ family protein [Candidatus Aenigmarchaeota archaeon]